MKRLVNVFAAVIMSLCLYSVLFSVQAADAKCGENMTYRFDEKTQTLYIEGSGKMYDYCQGDKKSEEYIKQPKVFSKAKHIVISDNITYIGKRAFEGCSELKTVDLGKSVKEIGKSAFVLCLDGSYENKLNKITVPDSVKTIGKYAFGYYDDLYSGKLNKTDGFVLEGKVGSAAYNYCEKYGIDFDDIEGCDSSSHKWGKKQTVKEKVCGKSRALYCNQCIKCGSRRYEAGKSLYHSFLSGTRKVLKKATYFEAGKEKKYCLDCNKYITSKIAKLELPYPENKKKKAKNQISYTFTNNNKKIPYYKVTVYTTDKHGEKDEKIKSYTVKNKKLTVKNLKKDTRYCFVIKTYYKKGNKVATRTVTEFVRTAKK